MRRTADFNYDAAKFIGRLDERSNVARTEREVCDLIKEIRGRDFVRGERGEAWNGYCNGKQLEYLEANPNGPPQ